MSTPSAPRVSARTTISGSTMPEHITRITRRFAGYCNRLTPARSAAAYAHHVQRNPRMWGLKLSGMLGNSFLSESSVSRAATVNGTTNFSHYESTFRRGPQAGAPPGKLHAHAFKEHLFKPPPGRELGPVISNRLVPGLSPHAGKPPLPGSVSPSGWQGDAPEGDRVAGRGGKGGASGGRPREMSVTQPWPGARPMPEGPPGRRPPGHRAAPW